MRQAITFLILVVSFFGYSQSLTKVQLEKLEYEELLEYYDKLNYDSIQGEIVARVYLDRARKENDTIKMARAYDRLARLFHPEKNIAFADSVIFLTKDRANITYPGIGFILKGYYYDKLGDLINSNRNFYKAYENATERNNISTQIYTLNVLISNKSHWGNGNDALRLVEKQFSLINNDSIIDKIEATFRKTNKYSSENIRKELLVQSIISSIICQIKLKKLAKADELYKEGRKVLDDYDGLEKLELETALLECLNEINYYSGNFRRVVALSDSLLTLSNTNYNFSRSFDANLFKGLSLFELSKRQSAYRCLYSADSIFTEHNLKMLPYRRDLYVALMKYHEEKNNVNSQILCLNKLIKWDSVFKLNYKYFESDMIKNFETPKLISEKERLIARLEKKNSRANVGLIVFIGVLTVLVATFWYYIKRQRVYKKRYEELIRRDSAKAEPNLGTAINSGRKAISTEVVDEILIRLEQFEKQKGYLSMKINLNDLAKTFNTNPNYLSRTINLKMEKNFSQYINDLRVVYIMDALKEDSKLRRYSINAIGAECGFKGADAFNRAFYKLNGFYPSFYLKQLKKEVG